MSNGRLSVPVFSQLALHDNTVMQGFARNPVYHSWVFSQLTQDGRNGKTGHQHSVDGDLTLSKVSAGGVLNAWMYLQGFGHGISIALEPDPATGGTWVWTETRSAVDPDTGDGFGTRIARFKWADSATLTPADVTVYGPNPEAAHHTPSLDLNAGLACERYKSATDGVTRAAAYHLSDFLNHAYPAISRTALTVPGTSQGWTVLPGGGQQFATLSGDAYSATNPPPGNTYLTTLGVDGTVLSQEQILSGIDLTWREPEGLTVADGILCCGFASGVTGARKANVFADSALP